MNQAQAKKVTTVARGAFEINIVPLPVNRNIFPIEGAIWKIVPTGLGSSE
jgi:hypothetical protein